jgi:DNA-binding PadR family transcriptional regulator
MVKPVLPSPYVLGATEANVLAATARYAYLTAVQARRLFFSRGSLTHVKALLKKLTDQGLLAVVAWSSAAGNRPYVYTLTPAGWKAVRELGLVAPDRFRRSEKVKVGAIFLDHVLAGTDVLISAELLAREQPGVTLLEVVHELDLRQRPTYVDTPDGRCGVIHDGFVDLAITFPDGVYRTPVALEIDRGTITQQKRWRERIGHFLAYLQGPYQQAFGAQTLTIAVLATPGPGRRDTLRAWTEAELSARGRRQDGPVFRFGALDPTLVSPAAFFFGPLWTVPFGTGPCPLIEGVSLPPGRGASDAALPS